MGNERFDFDLIKERVGSYDKSLKVTRNLHRTLNANHSSLTNNNDKELIWIMFSLRVLYFSMASDYAWGVDTHLHRNLSRY